MSRLQFILRDLQETALVLADMHGRMVKDPGDDILRVNAETVAKRGRDLETQLTRELRDRQVDLIQYRVEQRQGEPIPAAGLTSAVLLFQRIVTSIFDAVRDRPKQTYAPSAENVALSSMTVAAAKMIAPVELSLEIPNDRLLALQSELDLTFEATLRLLQSHSTEALKQLAARVGVSALSQAYRWAENAVEHRLAIGIRWQRSADQPVGVVVSADDALLLQRTIGASSIERLADFETELELTALDEIARTFTGLSVQGQLSGTLDLGFPRGERWVTYKRYAATLSRLTRVRCADGQEEIYWTLRNLADQT
jgi:hypothetical protein